MKLVVNSELLGPHRGLRRWLRPEDPRNTSHVGRGYRDLTLQSGDIVAYWHPCWNKGGTTSLLFVVLSGDRAGEVFAINPHGGYRSEEDLADFVFANMCVLVGDKGTNVNHYMQQVDTNLAEELAELEAEQEES